MNKISELKEKRYELRKETKDVEPMLQVFKIERDELVTEIQDLTPMNILFSCHKIRDAIQGAQDVFNENIDDLNKLNKKYNLKFKNIPKKMDIKLEELPEVLESKKDKKNK